MCQVVDEGEKVGKRIYASMWKPRGLGILPCIHLKCPFPDQTTLVNIEGQIEAGSSWFSSQMSGPAEMGGRTVLARSDASR